MLKATRTRLGSPAWLAVGLVILVPALAEAQLFPNRTIRREKPSCATEPPFYKQVRRDYFGYYPTCWSRFPDGWGCPCPDTELQRMRAEFAAAPPDLKPRPGLPNDTAGSDEEDSGMTNPRTRPNPGPDMMPDKPPSGVSPFETDPKPPIQPSTPRGSGPGTSGANLAPTAPSNYDLPSISTTTSNDPTTRSGSIAMYPEDATLTSNSGNSRPDLGPLPSAPTPAPFAPEGSSTVGSVVVNEGQPVMGTPVPAQAPKRRSLLSQLFSRGNTTTQNR